MLLPKIDTHFLDITFQKCVSKIGGILGFTSYMKKNTCFSSTCPYFVYPQILLKCPITCTPKYTHYCIKCVYFSKGKITPYLIHVFNMLSQHKNIYFYVMKYIEYM